MKKILLFLCIIFCSIAPDLISLELELIEGIGNLAYDTDRTLPLSDETNPGAFTPLYFPLALARISGESGAVSWNAGYKRDPISRNWLFGIIRFEQDYFFAEGGPSLGLFNTKKLPLNPGISAGFGLMLPGIIFIEASGSSTLAAIPMDKEGNYSLISADLSAGFWVPYVVCSFNIKLQNFTLRERTTLLIEDELIRYYFRADVFTKNFPYTVRVDLGYQNLKRSYTSLEVDGSNIVQTNITDEFKSLFVGLEGTFAVTPGLKLVLGAEMPIYFWSVRPMKDPSREIKFYEIRAGIILTVPVQN